MGSGGVRQIRVNLPLGVRRHLRARCALDETKLQAVVERPTADAVVDPRLLEAH